MEPCLVRSLDLARMQVDNGVVLSFASDPGSGMEEFIDRLKTVLTHTMQQKT